MKKQTAFRLLTLLSLTGLALPAHADTAPDDFLGPDDCRALSPDCKCSDAPMLELLLKDQSKALDAWDATADAIAMPGGPATMEAAVQDFHSRFPGDTRIADQFAACDTIDEGGHNLTKIAGVSIRKGGAALDSCFCKQFCEDAVNATIIHEDVHFKFAFEAMLEMITSSVACKLGELEQSYCDTLLARQLARSEQYAHAAAIESMQDSLDELRASDPDMPDMECTWEPLPDMVTRVTPPAPPAPSGLWQRIELLADRFIHGAARAG
jgi:hypothetical protein